MRIGMKIVNDMKIRDQDGMWIVIGIGMRIKG